MCIRFALFYLWLKHIEAGFGIIIIINSLCALFGLWNKVQRPPHVLNMLSCHHLVLEQTSLLMTNFIIFGFDSPAKWFWHTHDKEDGKKEDVVSSWNFTRNSYPLFFVFMVCISFFVGMDCLFDFVRILFLTRIEHENRIFIYEHI